MAKPKNGIVIYVFVFIYIFKKAPGQNAKSGINAKIDKDKKGNLKRKGGK